MGTKQRNVKSKYIELTKEEIITRGKDKIVSILENKIHFTAKNESQKQLIKSIINNEITISAGTAGTGKSFIALATALNLLFDHKNPYNKLYLVKSVTPLKGEEVGFLKGDLMEKLEPFMWSFSLNISKIVGEDKFQDLIDNKIVNYLPLTYLRGVTIDNSIVILDECQNTTIDNARTVLSRISDTSKLICIGDTNQIDLKNQSDSSLYVLTNILQGIDGIGVVNIDDNDGNLRNPLIPKIENKFKEFYKSKKNG